MELFSKIASWVFLPLLMPVYALTTVMFIPSGHAFEEFQRFSMYSMDLNWKWLILALYFLFTTALPGLSYLIMYRTGIVSTAEMDDRKERWIPMATTIAYTIVLYFFITNLFSKIPDAPKYISNLALAGILVSVCFVPLNSWKKVSVHAAGAGIFTGFLIAYIAQHTYFSIWLAPLALVVSGTVMTARLYLEKHSLTEVSVGWSVGAFVTFAVNFWL
jgi:membrane-associated phospholipid phosphatase